MLIACEILPVDAAHGHTNKQWFYITEDNFKCIMWGEPLPWEKNFNTQKSVSEVPRSTFYGILFFPSSVSCSDSSSLLFLGFKRPMSAMFRPGKPVITCTSHLMLSYQQAPLWVTVVSHCCETLKRTDGHTLTQQPWIGAGEGSPGPGLRSETPDWDGL